MNLGLLHGYYINQTCFQVAVGACSLVCYCLNDSSQVSFTTATPCKWCLLTWEERRLVSLQPKYVCAVECL